MSLFDSSCYLSLPWSPGPSHVTLRAVSHSAITPDTARQMLAPPEHARWAALPGASPRRQSYLMGRVAAKEAVSQWASTTHRLNLHPVHIEIRSAGTGRPFVDGPLVTEHGLCPHLSITHTRTTAVAAVSDPGTYPGIDLEEYDTQRLGRGFPDLFSAAERAMATRAGRLESNMLLRLWAVKEAAAKAVGIGLRGTPQDWMVAQYGYDTGADRVGGDALIHAPSNDSKQRSQWHLAVSGDDIHTARIISGHATVVYRGRQLYVRFWHTATYIFACCLTDRLLPADSYAY